MDQARKKAEGEAVRAFLGSALWIRIIEPELRRRKGEHLISANLYVDNHALMSKAIGAHGELVDLQRWLEFKAVDADLDLTQPAESGPSVEA